MSHSNRPPTGSNTPFMHGNNAGSAFRTIQQQQQQAPPSPMGTTPTNPLGQPPQSQTPTNITPTTTSVKTNSPTHPPTSITSPTMSHGSIPASPSRRPGTHQQLPPQMPTNINVNALTRNFPQPIIQPQQLTQATMRPQTSASRASPISVHPSTNHPSITYQQLQSYASPTTPQRMMSNQHHPNLNDRSLSYPTIPSGSQSPAGCLNLPRKASAPSPLTSSQQQAYSSAKSSRSSSVAPLNEQTNQVAPPTPSPPRSERNSPVNTSSIPAFPNNYVMPILTPPPQFTTVESCFYRSARFNESHLPFLATLQLRTIVYLSPPSQYPLSSTIKQWCLESGVDIYNVGSIVFNETNLDTYDITSSRYLSLYSDLIKLALDHILLAPHSPLLLMCHNGIDLCSMVIGCLRRLQGWSYTSLLEEFTRFHSSMMLRDEVMGRRNKEQTNSSTNTTATTGLLRYTLSNSERMEDVNHTYRMEELMEIFDLNQITIPDLQLSRRSFKKSQSSPSSLSSLISASSSDAATPPSFVSPSSPSPSLCVPWFRDWCMVELRERRTQRRAKRRQRKLMPPITTSNKSTATNKLEEEKQLSEGPAIKPPILASLDPAMLFTSSSLISSNVRYDKKLSLVDEDED